MNSHNEINTGLIDALQSTGMLIRLSTSSFGTQATDREKSREITDNAQASSDAARVVVNRLPGKAKLYHAKLTKTQSMARQVINDMTTPWDESGWRLLLTTRFDELARALALIKKDFDAGLTALSTNADEVISDAKAALGDLGANVRMPTKEDMINSYSMKTDIVPIPDGAQFRNLPPSTKALLQERLDRRLRTNAASRASWSGSSPCWRLWWTASMPTTTASQRSRRARRLAVQGPSATPSYTTSHQLLSLLARLLV